MPHGPIHLGFIICCFGLTLVMLALLVPRFYSLRLFESGISFPTLFSSQVIPWENVVGFEVSAENRVRLKYHPESDVVADPNNRVVTSLELPSIAEHSAEELAEELNEWRTKQSS